MTIRALIGTVLLLAFLAVPASASAAAGCSYPDGDAGDLMYNGEFHVLQWCDGADWQSVWNRHGVPTAGLVAHWTFGDDSGTTARDAVGDNHGTLVNMDPNSWVDGKIGGALEFDGVDDEVSISGLLGNPANITISAWANFSGTGLFWLWCPHNASHSMSVLVTGCGGRQSQCCPPGLVREQRRV